MKFIRDRWTPLTVTFETPQEAEALHKILALVTDDTDERWAFDLFIRLGDNLGDASNYTATGIITLKEAS